MTEPRLLVRAPISSALHLAAYRDPDAGQVRWFAEFRSDDHQTPPSRRRLKVEIAEQNAQALLLAAIRAPRSATSASRLPEIPMSKEWLGIALPWMTEVTS
jgi:hypothetical protein